MYNDKAIVIGLCSFVILFSFIPTSQAVLWDFILELDMEKDVVYSGDTVVVTGRVIDHAYHPTRGVEVLVRTGADTTKAFTNPDGEFKAQFVNFQRIPGTYTVNVVASWYGMTGLSSTQFQVKGDANPVSMLQQQLSTDEARKYLSSNESDFDRNPIGQTLFKYYHGLHDQLITKQKESQKPIAEEMLLEQQRRIAENLRNQAIEEYKPGYGTYGGYKYEDYIVGLNPEIRGLVINQLNFTQNNFLDAQKIRAEILENGGTYAEARQAYLDRLTIPKEILEKFNEMHLEDSEKEPEKQTSEE